MRGDALRIPLPDESVDLIVTSPPYWALRSYRDGDEHYDGQLGSEPDPFAFLDVLLEATAEMVRVLKPSGSLWVNLGDKYAERTGPARDGSWKGCQDSATFRQAPRPRRLKTKGVRPKSLIMIPQRYAIRCIDELGLILRAEVVWNKPNSLPESVTDRVRRSHEHLFHFTKEPTYYAAMDEVRERHTGTSNRGRSDGKPPPNGKVDRLVATGDHGGNYGGTNPDMFNPLGKLPGSVWSIPAEPLQVPDYFVEDALGWRMMDAKPLWNYAWHQVVRAGNTTPIMVRSIDHFAAFPQELPRRIILGWSPSAICTVCGQGRFPVVAKGLKDDRPRRMQDRDGDSLAEAHGADGRAGSRRSTEAAITGYACACTPSGPRYCPTCQVQWQGVETSLSRLAGSPQTDVPGVRQGVSAERVATENALLPGLLEQGERSDTLQLQGVDDHDSRVSHAVSTGAPQRHGGRLRDGAPAGDGGGARPAADGRGGRPPSQRDEAGQSAGEPGGSAEAGARQAPEASPAASLPKLRTRDPLPQSALCPTCGGGLTLPPTRPSRVLDPFGGTGTTAGVADALGRIGIALDLSADYCRLARWRTEQSGHFAKTRERTNRENQGSLL